MSQFFRTSTLWVVDFHYRGRLRRWFRTFGPGDDVAARMSERLRELYGERAQLIGVRRATDEEESMYLRGEQPANAFCPTGRGGPPDPGS